MFTKKQIMLIKLGRSADELLMAIVITIGIFSMFANILAPVLVATVAMVLWAPYALVKRMIWLALK